MNIFRFDNNKPAAAKKEKRFPAFEVMTALLAVTLIGSAVFFNKYQPIPKTPAAPVTLEQKMEHIKTGTPLPGADTRPEIPKWLMALILAFVVIQIAPLLVAAHITRSQKMTLRGLRQIEFLSETPLYLGLLGSLLGVAMNHFLSGSMSAPLAYLTTISGILLYLFGRFFILLSLPSTTELLAE